MININELRIGNVLNYQTSEDEMLPTKIDWQDFRELTESPKKFNESHSLIPLAEKHFVDAGYVCAIDNSAGKAYYFPFNDGLLFVIWKDGKIYRNGKQIKFLHRLQNIHFTETEEELILINQ